MILTAAGKTYLRHAEAAIASLESGFDHVHEISSVRALSIRLGAIPTVDGRLVSEILNALDRTRPSMHVEIRTANSDQLHAQLLSGELDMALGGPPQSGYETLNFRQLYSEKLKLVEALAKPSLQG